MKYFVGHLLEGAAERYHQGLVHDVASRFGVHTTAGFKAPSHITFKYLSQRGVIADVEKVLEKLCDRAWSSDFGVGGIGNFDSDVLYLNVTPSKQMVAFRNSLFEQLRNLKDISWYAWDNGKVPNFHVTICEGDIEDKFEEIRRYLEEYNCNFNMRFDNIAILKKPADRWVLHRRFDLR